MLVCLLSMMLLEILDNSCPQAELVCPFTFTSAKNCLELHLNEIRRPADQLFTLSVQQ